MNTICCVRHHTADTQISNLKKGQDRVSPDPSRNINYIALRDRRASDTPRGRGRSSVVQRASESGVRTPWLTVATTTPWTCSADVRRWSTLVRSAARLYPVPTGFPGRLESRKKRPHRSALCIRRRPCRWNAPPRRSATSGTYPLRVHARTDANAPRGAGGQEWSFVSLNLGFPVASPLAPRSRRRCRTGRSASASRATATAGSLRIRGGYGRGARDGRGAGEPE